MLNGYDNLFSIRAATAYYTPSTSTTLLLAGQRFCLLLGEVIGACGKK